jgi:hypothetical protein
MLEFDFPVKELRHFFMNEWTEFAQPASVISAESSDDHANIECRLQL